MAMNAWSLQDMILTPSCVSDYCFSFIAFNFCSIEHHTSIVTILLFIDHRLNEVGICLIDMLYWSSVHWTPKTSWKPSTIQRNANIVKQTWMCFLQMHPNNSQFHTLPICFNTDWEARPFPPSRPGPRRGGKSTNGLFCGPEGQGFTKK